MCFFTIEVLHSEKKPKKEKIVPFISTFNPNITNIYPVIRSTFQNLQESTELKRVFKDYKLIKSLRQPPNLERILCKSKFSDEKQVFTVKKCGKSCFCCEYVREGQSYKFINSDKDFILKTNFTCESSNLIYVVICNGCKEEYIGQTGTTLKDRVSTYKQHIKQPQYQQIKVEEHLRTCGEHKFNIFPFFKIKEENKLLRESYEDHFIKKFKPKLNARI